uniref:Uncharacterized protein n=1 Tax=Anguilla anguilla TaxID=7936 RepID=A0A0E9XBR6_ANGAN
MTSIHMIHLLRKRRRKRTTTQLYCSPVFNCAGCVVVLARRLAPVATLRITAAKNTRS